MTDLYNPAYDTWGEVFHGNLISASVLHSALGTGRVAAIRRELISSAVQYTALLNDVAKRIGVAQCEQSKGTLNSDTAVIMAGHQPVVYHPGLIRKSEALARFAAVNSALGINVVIDTDQGNGGALVWPKVSGESLELKRASIVEDSSGTNLYSEQRVASADLVKEIFSEIEVDLRDSGLGVEAEQVRYVGELYQRLSGELISVANSVVRWALVDCQVLEVPLSALVLKTELRVVLHEFFRDGLRLVELYNSNLDAYRREHKIANLANPFPNMKRSDTQIELPFWRLQNGARHQVHLDLNADTAADPSDLIPRGSITTMLLRGFCSDLFIHGLGGARYDQFVDRFAKVYLGVDLPRFVVASATEYLFPGRVSELKRSLELASKLKEMTSRTEDFLGKGIFTEIEEAQLKSLSSQRRDLREELKLSQSAVDRTRISHELNTANRAVRQIIESGSLRDHLKNVAANEAALVRWSFREFPFFLYRLPRSA
jgi:hypothetical protein